MLTLGVDLASAAQRTAICCLRWEDGRAQVERLERRADDDALVAAITEVDKAGVDVPFGWPSGFVEAVSVYSASGRWPTTVPLPTVAPKQLQFRATDRFVHARTGRWPLSVSADRIAIPTMRAAAVFSRLADSGAPVARDGSGKIIEVYPAAALRVWGFDAQRYKRKENRESRCRLLGVIMDATDVWLDAPESTRGLCESSDDALDALVAAMVARAAAVGMCEPLPPEYQAAALKEGWIAIPAADSLARLAATP